MNKLTWKDIPWILALIVMIYLAICVVDVNLHNLGDTNYAWWNILDIIWG